MHDDLFSDPMRQMDEDFRALRRQVPLIMAASAISGAVVTAVLMSIAARIVL